MMGIFVSTAWAQEAAASGPAGYMPQLMGFLPVVLIFAIFYFLVIRPQVQQDKEHAKLLEALKKGDVAVTTGGVLGEVAGVEDGLVRLKVADGVVVVVNKPSVVRVLGEDEAKTFSKMMKK